MSDFSPVIFLDIKGELGFVHWGVSLIDDAARALKETDGADELMPVAVGIMEKRLNYSKLNLNKLDEIHSFLYESLDKLNDDIRSLPEKSPLGGENSGETMYKCTTALGALLVVVTEEIERQKKLKCIKEQCEAYGLYLEKHEAKFSSQMLYEGKKQALQSISEEMNKDVSRHEKLQNIQTLINSGVLDILEKADTMGELFLKGVQQILNPILKAIGVDVWKSRLHEMKGVIKKNDGPSPKKN